MDRQTIFLIIAAVLLGGFLLFKLLTAKKARRMRLLARIANGYGKVPDREYSEEELRKIRRYFEKVHEDDTYYVDDITWNDLDLDAIFIAMNHTYSSVGEEVLYDILREPVFDRETLRERNKLIEFFRHSEGIREELQVDFATIGRTRKYALVDFLDRFRQLTLQPNGKYIIHLVLILVSIAVIFIQPAVGIAAFLVVMIYNMCTYFKSKGNVEPYYVSLLAIGYLIEAGERIGKHTAPEILPYTEAIREDSRALKPVSKNMKWLGAGQAIGSSADLLQVVADYFRMITHFDFVKFNEMVRFIVNQEDRILRLMKNIGMLEAMIAIGSFRETLPFFCTGDPDPESRDFVIENGYHPLVRDAVANSIDTASSVLLTGSNASGKSTFLRMTALCALMAETTATIPAKYYRSAFYRVYSSMALRDNIVSGESYYMVEIKSIKRILDAIPGEVPVLCFVDEVLRGTNTVERIAASSEILRSFTSGGARVFAATHDIELTTILEGIYANYHFEETFRNGQISFDYRLLEGRATTRNAIKLLASMGYDEAVVKGAEASAEHFMTEGQWRKI